VAFFFALGLLVSTISGFLVGNRVTHIAFVSTISSLAFAAMGFGIHYILELKVPEFLEILSGIESKKESSADGGASNSHSPNFRPSSSSADSGASVDIKSDDLGVEISRSPKEKVKDGKYGDHIIVENITIKNEPKLMAEAIRTMLSKDDDAGG